MPPDLIPELSVVQELLINRIAHRFEQTWPVSILAQLDEADQVTRSFLLVELVKVDLELR